VCKSEEQLLEDVKAEEEPMLTSVSFSPRGGAALASPNNDDPLAVKFNQVTCFNDHEVRGSVLADGRDREGVDSTQNIAKGATRFVQNSEDVEGDLRDFYRVSGLDKGSEGSAGATWRDRGSTTQLGEQDSGILEEDLSEQGQSSKQP
jgi:hypothetical protein